MLVSTKAPAELAIVSVFIHGTVPGRGVLAVLSVSCGNGMAAVRRVARYIATPRHERCGRILIAIRGAIRAHKWHARSSER